MDTEEAIQKAREHDRTCRTVGWIVYEDDELVVLAGSIGCADPPQIGDMFEVPRRVIEKMTDLRESTRLKSVPDTVLGTGWDG